MWEAIAFVLFGVIMFFAGVAAATVRVVENMAEIGSFKSGDRRYVVIRDPSQPKPENKR